MLFNEPKLLKWMGMVRLRSAYSGFSALQRAEIAEINYRRFGFVIDSRVSVLFNEPKLLKSPSASEGEQRRDVSVLFNEPKLLKSKSGSASRNPYSVSVLFNEPKLLK